MSHPSLLVLCPTRGRPHEAKEAYDAFVATKELPGTRIIFAIDDDDPLAVEYDHDTPTLLQRSPGNMVHALNMAAAWAIEHLEPDYLGFIGDDHRFRTKGWDRYMLEALEAKGGGLAYGNDLFWAKGEIPTQIFMSASIVGALGWMGLPTCTHLYIDNAWRKIGEELQCLYYMPDIVIEHMHPAAGKGGWDEGHLRVNTEAMYSHDREAFEHWVATSAEGDIARARATYGSLT